LGRVAQGEEGLQPGLVVRKFDVLLLGDDLRPRLLPLRDAAGVVGVHVRQDDVADRRGALGPEQLHVPWCVGRARRVDDHVAGRRDDQEGVAEADRLVNGVVDLEGLFLIAARVQQVGGVVEGHLTPQWGGAGVLVLGDARRRPEGQAQTDQGEAAPHRVHDSSRVSVYGAEYNRRHRVLTRETAMTSTPSSVWVAFAAAAVFGLAGPAAAEPPKSPPNVLFIAVDDLNDWVGCLGGHPQVKTPHIDRLAARGTLFTNAHCQAPICNPSRSSLLTGLRPSTTGIYGLQPGIRAVASLKDWVTLPQHFAAHGYFTFTAGKVFHDGSIPPKERPREFIVW